MPLFRRTKAAPKMPGLDIDQVWGDQTYQMRERLKSQHFSRNPEVNEFLQHSVGVAHNCATTNATVCTAGVLRLYRRVGASGDQTRMGRGGKVYGAKSIEHKRMQRGRYGGKVADFTQGGAQMQEVESHPILDYLSNPNPTFPGEELTWLGWYYKFICGIEYSKAQTQGGMLTATWPLYSQFVQVRVNDQDEKRYIYGRSDQVWGEYGEDEVIETKLRPNPHSPLTGMGAMHGVLPWVDLIRDTLIHNIWLSKNGMRMDGILSIPEGTGEEQEKALMKRLESKFRGVRNWYKWLVVTGDVKFQQASFNEKDIMSIEKEDRAERLIRNAFGHTDSMNSSDDSTYAGALVGYNDQFLGGVIEPALQFHAAQLNSRLLWRFGLDEDKYALAYDPMVTKDEKVEIETLILQSNAALMTINEVRQERGLPKSNDPNADKLMFNGVPLGSGGGGLFGGFDFGGSDTQSTPPGSAEDKPTQTQQPAGNADAPEGTQPVEGVGQPAKVEETALNGAQIDKLVEVALKISSGELPKEAGRAIIIAAFPGIPPEKIEAIFAELIEGSAPPEDQTDPDVAKSAKAFVSARFKSILHTHESPLWRDCGECRHTKDDDDLRAYDAKLRDAIRRMQGQVESVARDVVTDMQSEALDAIGKGRTPNLAPIVEQSAPMFADAMKDIVRLGVTNILESGQFGGSVPDEAFNIAPERALRFLETYSFELAGELADTTVKMTETAVRNGLEQGLSIADIAAEMEGFPEYRAEAIARTETNRAYNAGHREGARSVGVEEYRILTAPGVRASHRAIAERGWTPMDEPIVKAGETIEGETFSRDLFAPPLSVNCRCSLTFRFEGE